MSDLKKWNDATLHIVDFELRILPYKDLVEIHTVFEQGIELHLVDIIIICVIII